MLRLLFFNGLFVGIGLIIVELIFGTWFSDAHALMKFTQMRDRQIIQDNPLPGGKPQITYTRDEYAFRGLDGPVSEIDILTVGGSTTDQRWIDDEETYQEVLEQKFAEAGHTIDVVNAGIDGQSTFGHIANFTSWFHEIPDLKADYILYYIGVNDLLVSAPKKNFDTMEIEDTAQSRFKAMVKDKSIFYQLYRLFKEAVLEDHNLNGLNPSNIANREPLVREALITDDVDMVLGPSIAGFVDRIAELDRLTRDFGAIPIFVTQRSARWTRQDGEILGIAEYEPDFFEIVRQQLPEKYQTINGMDFYRLERGLADAMMTECTRLGAICLDLMAEATFNLSTDFYDAVHTTASGSKAVGSYMYEALRAQGIID